MNNCPTPLVIGLGAAAFVALGLVSAAMLAPLPRPAQLPASPEPSLPAAVLPLSPVVPSTSATVAPPPLTLAAVGDIMLDRNVETVIRRQGASFLFDGVRELLANRDVVFGNLEGPIIARHRQTVTGSLVFSFPSSTAALLQREGFTVVALANNHGLDHGAKGFSETREYLRAAGVRFAGHPKIIADEHAASWEVRDATVTLLAYNAVWPEFDLAEAVAQVERFASATDQFTIVSLHWGNEYVPRANARQTAIAQALIDAGADLIIGHHPHVVQNLEAYQGAMIFYSLGNFIFDQYFSPETQEGLAFTLERLPTEDRFTLYPYQSAQSQPALLVGDERSKWLDAYAASSAPMLAPMVRTGVLTLPR